MRKILCCSFLLFGLLLFFERRFPSFAAAVDRLVGAPLRALLSGLSSRVGGSLAEWGLLLSPLALLVLLGVALTASSTPARTRRLIRLLLCFLLALFAVYALAFAPGEHRAPLAEVMGLDAREPSSGEVLACVAWLSSLAECDLPYPGDGAVRADLCAAFSDAGRRYGFSPNTAVAVKESTTPLLLRLGYFGLYAFPLGEITLERTCPAATRSFTLAHEMAHASGFSREEEADVIAFLACLDSGDAYLTAAAASGMLGRALSALYDSAPALWEQASGMLSEAARQELSDAGEVYERGACEAGASVSEDYGAALTLLCAVWRARGGTQ